MKERSARAADLRPLGCVRNQAAARRRHASRVLDDERAIAAEHHSHRREEDASAHQINKLKDPRCVGRGWRLPPSSAVKAAARSLGRNHIDSAAALLLGGRGGRAGRQQISKSPDSAALESRCSREKSGSGRTPRDGGKRWRRTEKGYGARR
jgi:hypothetical protein